MRYNYPLEEALSNVCNVIGYKPQKPIITMNEDDLSQLEKELNPYINWVEHPNYIQLVPQLKNGTLILN